MQISLFTQMYQRNRERKGEKQIENEGKNKQTNNYLYCKVILFLKQLPTNHSTGTYLPIFPDVENRCLVYLQ